MKPTFILLAISLLLAACGTAAPEPTAVPPTNTPLPSATPTVTPSPEPTFTPTPEPLTIDDVEGMDEDSKLQVLKDKYPDMVEGNNLFCSAELPNICVVDTGTDYLLFDVIQGEFVSVDEAGLTILRLTEKGKSVIRDGNKGWIEWSSTVGADSLFDDLLNDKISLDDLIASHPDADYLFKRVLQSPNFTDLQWVQGGARREVILHGGYVVFCSEVLVNGRGAVLVRYVNESGKLVVRILYDANVNDIIASYGVR